MNIKILKEYKLIIKFSRNTTVNIIKDCLGAKVIIAPFSYQRKFEL